MNDREEERRAKQARERLRADLTRLFPDTQTPWTAPGDEAAWNAGEESFLSLAKGADVFGRTWLDDARGVYDILSDYSHPSLMSLESQTERIEADGRIELLYIVHPETYEWQAKLACFTLYRAAHLVAGYFSLDIEILEAWADQADRTRSWFHREPRPDG
jgi:hypothetical protein